MTERAARAPAGGARGGVVPPGDAIRAAGGADPAGDAADAAAGGAVTGAVPPADRRRAPLTEADLEALLFVAERPLSRREIVTLGGSSAEQVDALLGDLAVSLGSRGIRLVAVGERVALATAPETGDLVGRYVGGDPARLSPAMLETLAIVAYRQPVTRAVIEHVRGVDSDYVLRSLLHRRLVVELGRAPTPGRPFLYGTGYEFLERFGLPSLDDLPPLGAEVAERLLSAGGDGGPTVPLPPPSSGATPGEPAPGGDA